MLTTRLVPAAALLVIAVGPLPTRSPSAPAGSPAVLATDGVPSRTADDDSAGRDLELVGQAGGRITAIAVAGDLAYCGQGARLRIADFGAPPAVSWLGQTDVMGERVADVTVHGTLAYVACGYDGLQVVDVSDPSAPTRVGGTRLDPVPDFAGEHVPAALRVSVAAGLAAVLTNDGVQWLDVSDATSPQVLGVFSNRADPYSPDCARDVSVLGGSHALVAQGENGLVALDLTRPDQAVPLARLTGMRPRAIAVSGAHAYLASEEPPGLFVLDVADPTEPVEVARLRLPRAPSDVWVAGERAYLAYGDAANGLSADAWYEAGASVTAVDVSPPLAPRDLGLHHLDDVEGYAALAFAEGFALVGSPSGILQRVELAGCQGTRAAGAYDPGWYHTREMAIRDGWLYALDGYGQLQVVQLAETGGPGARTTFAPGFAAVSMALGDRRAYLGRDGGGLAVVDTSDPAHPRVLGILEAGWRSEDLSAEGDRIAAAAGREGLRLVDVSDPARPAEIAALTSGPWVQRAALAGRHVHLVRASPEGQRGVELVDLSEPTSPRLAGTYASDLFVWDLAASDGRLLLTGRTADRREATRLYDLSDPAAPELVGPVELLSPSAVASHLALEWPYAAAVDYHEAAVRDLSAGAEALRRVAGVRWPSLHGLALGDGFAYAGHAWARGYTVLPRPSSGDADGSAGAYRRGSPGATAIEAGDGLVWALTDAHEDSIADALELLDGREPASMSVRARWVAAGQVVDFRRSGGLVLALVRVAADETQRLQVLRTGQGSTIETVGQLSLAGSRYRRLAVEGDTVWLVRGTTTTELTRVDLTDPTRPAETWRAGLAAVGAPRDVAAAEGHVVVLTSEALLVLDGADPGGAGLLAECPGPFAGPGLAVTGGRAYAATTDGRVVGVQLRDPFECRVSAEGVLPPGAKVVAASAERLYVGHDLRPYLGVLDLADPTARGPMRSERLWRVGDAAFADGLLWLATGATGVVALDPADAPPPPPSSRTREWPRASGIDRDGDLVAVAAGSDGLRLLDITDRRRPTEVGAFPGIDAADVALVGDHAYVAAGDGGLVVVDVSEPARPRETARLALGGATRVLAGRASACVICASRGLALVDTRDPASPAVLGEVAGEGVSGRLALSADGRLAVTTAGAVIDLSDPASPRVLARIDVGAPARDVALVGSSAYLDGPESVYDLTDPAHPRRLKAVAEPSDMVGRLHRLAASGRWLIAAATGGTVLAYDVADPDHVLERGRYARGAALAPLGDPYGDGPDRLADSLYAEGDLVLVGGADDGLWVFGWSDPAADTWVALLPAALRGALVGSGLPQR